MKKTILLLALFVSFAAFPQQFPGADLSLLIGKDVRVKPLSKGSRADGYNSFYSDNELRRHYKRKDAHSARTEAEHLEGRVFHVATAEGIPNTDYAILKLVDATSQETIYYKYYTKSAIIFKLEIIGNEVPAPMPVATSAYPYIAPLPQFPGQDINVLYAKNVRVKPLPNSIRAEGYISFYEDPELKRHYKQKKPKGGTEAGLLEGRELLVVAVVDIPDTDYAILKLSDMDDDSVIYYKYHKKNAEIFNLEILRDLYDPNPYCDYVKKEIGGNSDGTDRFISLPKEGIIFSKLKEGTEETYFIAGAISPGKIQAENGSIFLVLKNDHNIKKDKVSIVNNVAAFALSEDDVSLLMEFPIIGFKVESEIMLVEDGYALKDIFLCLVDKQ